MNTSALTDLNAAFTGPFQELGRHAERDRDAVVVSWPSVPVEIIRAAGCRPVFAHSGVDPTPFADEVLEAGIFPGRLRHLVEAALTGRLAHVAAIVLPRTSDPDYKCFLYLREFARRGMGDLLPPVLLFDLLQSAGPEVQTHDIACCRTLLDQLVAIPGRRPALADLSVEVSRANIARRAARRIMALRHGDPRISGTEVLPLLGAFWQLPPERYAALACLAVDEIAMRKPLSAARVLLAGSPVDSGGLHAAIEAQQAIVVDELSPFGGDVAGEDVATMANPLVAIAAKYRRDSLSSRTPVAAVAARFADALAGIDAVVISLPPDDATFGWDYPRLRQLLNLRGIAHAVVTCDPAAAISATDTAQLAALINSATSRAVRHG